jgi:hypothetical protein
MSLHSEIVTDEPVALGFWHRLTTAVVSAVIPFWVVYGIFSLITSSTPNQTVYYSTPTALRLINDFSGVATIILGGVLLIGYPVERFWVKPSDSGLAAARKYGLLFLTLLVAGAVLGGVTSGFLGAYILGLIFLVSGVTACVGRLIYSYLVRFKFQMYVAAGSIGGMLTISLIHYLVLGLQVTRS